MIGNIDLNPDLLPDQTLPILLHRFIYNLLQLTFCHKIVFIRVTAPCIIKCLFHILFNLRQFFLDTSRHLTAVVLDNHLRSRDRKLNLMDPQFNILLVLFLDLLVNIHIFRHRLPRILQDLPKLLLLHTGCLGKHLHDQIFFPKFLHFLCSFQIKFLFGTEFQICTQQK